LKTNTEENKFKHYSAYRLLRSLQCPRVYRNLDVLMYIVDGYDIEPRPIHTCGIVNTQPTLSV